MRNQHCFSALGNPTRICSSLATQTIFDGANAANHAGTLVWQAYAWSQNAGYDFSYDSSGGAALKSQTVYMNGKSG